VERKSFAIGSRATFSNVDSMLGASLAAQKKFAEAEPLRVSGYEGMGRSGRAADNSITRFTREDGGRAVVELYKDWGNPTKQSEWEAKLSTD
jgi:hypothetical protein